ncbi:MAG TPA: hypothetical protein VEI58_04835 [Chthoniobacterales bacterium]|nr:hypothetical protein [Chthoniobacterales bacterium]
MKHPTFYNLSLAAIVLLFVAGQASARPIGFSEISLMLRMHESEASIRDEVAQRKLLHALTGPQETLLKSQGASDSLVQSLRNSSLVASKEEVAAAEAAAAHQSASTTDEAQMYDRHHGPHIVVFDVAMGHPINLSQWGGLDYEIAFYSYRFAGEDHIQPAFIDPVGTRTVVSRIVPTGSTSEGELLSDDWYPTNGVRNWRYTPYNGTGGTLYNGRGDFRDTRSFNFGDSVGYSSFSVSRPIVIDWDNPVFFDGQPYTFYPVYGSGGVSLYYISSSSDSVKLAVCRNGSSPSTLFSPRGIP